MKEQIRKLFNHPEFGLLLLRFLLGSLMIALGVPKFLGGQEVLIKLGSAMAIFGINFAPVFWGFMAALSETLGGFLFILGLFFKPACFFLFMVMLVAITFHVSAGHKITVISHPLGFGILFLSLMFIGPGKYAFDKS